MSFKIGNILIDKTIGLAPLAGFSNQTFRSICLDNGAGYAISEMISSKAIFYHNEKTLKMIKTVPTILPQAIQLFGDDEESLVFAVELLNLDKNIAFIDLNAGCPVPKIAIKSHSGASLMKDIPLLSKLVKAMVKASNKPITVKIRTGWDSNSLNAPEVAAELEKAGASAIFIHGRTKEAGYDGPIDFDTIKKVKDAVKIPVIGNGDIKTTKDALNFYDKTGVDGLLIGRESIGNPWIFEQINNELLGIPYTYPTVRDVINMLNFHLTCNIQLVDEQHAVSAFRTVLPKYLKKIGVNKRVLTSLMRMTKYSEIIDLISSEFDQDLTN